jgi:hypothetical protein
MTKSGKRQKPKEAELWCECECPSCEIGTHERCNSSKCHMPKWKDIKPRPRKDSR